ncbi:hypothetical protein GCM10027568_31830 [Humibacter soli]
MLDTGHPWGTFYVGYWRHGLRTLRLVVYPPGISQRERVALRLWRAWPFVGGALCLIGVVLCLPAWTAAVTIMVGTLIITVVLAYNARRTRRLVREGFAVENIDNSGDRGAVHLRSLATLLDQAENDVETGNLSPVHYEIMWATAYAQLAE